MTQWLRTFQLRTFDAGSLLISAVGASLLILAVGRTLNPSTLVGPNNPVLNVPPAAAGAGFSPMVEVEQAALPPVEEAGRALPNQGIARPDPSVAAETDVQSLPDGRTVAASQVPLKLIIPNIALNAPVVTASLATTQFDGGQAYQWLAPDYQAAGWHYTSAPLGEPGNTVINGHHNAFGEVFRDLEQLEIGDRIFVQSSQGDYRYVITNIHILAEKYAAPEVRRRNARWISRTADERLTLVTCWPYESNANRLLIIARPLTASNSSGLLESP